MAVDSLQNAIKFAPTPAQHLKLKAPLEGGQTSAPIPQKKGGVVTQQRKPSAPAAHLKNEVVSKPKTAISTKGTQLKRRLDVTA